MTGAQNLVGFGGAGLVFANFWLGGQRKTVADGLFNKGGSTSASHGELLKLGGEMLFVIVATLLAGMGGGIETLMVVVIVALWVLWAINHWSPGTLTASTNTKGGPVV